MTLKDCPVNWKVTEEPFVDVRAKEPPIAVALTSSIQPAE
jgi:hypothetical protein